MARGAAMMLRVVALVVLAGADEYDRECDAIVTWGQRAGSLFNRGDRKQAASALEAAESAFSRAVALNDKEPQAYVNFATLMLNANRFKESVKHWDQAIERTADPKWNQYLRDRKRYTKYGFYSSRRDKVYDGGKGNMTEALRYTFLQAEVCPSPEIYFNAATIMLMLSETNASMIRAAEVSFDRQMHLAFEGWVEGMGRLGKSCSSGKELVRDWPQAGPGGPVVEAEVAPGTAQGDEIYISKFTDVALSGGDGIILSWAPNLCHMYVPSASHYINYARQVQTLGPWGFISASGEVGWDDPSRGGFRNHGAGLVEPTFVEKGASIIQFASSSYYHFVLECLGRLLLMLPLLDSDKEIRLIIPKRTKSNAFIRQYLELLPQRIDDDRIIEYDTNGPNDVLLRAKVLYYANWNNKGTEDEPVHCVMPPSGIQMIRRAFEISEKQQPRSLVLWLTRRDAGMRRLKDEERVVAKLKKATGSSFEFLVFRAKDYPDRRAAIAVFQRAAAVLGVHGGALSSIVHCRAGTTVIEFGFGGVPQSRHYRHVAKALDLDYHLAPVTSAGKGLGLSAPWVEATAEGVERAVSVVSGLGKRSDRPGGEL